LLPSGVTATPKGPRPTGIVAITVGVAVSITDTVLESDVGVLGACRRRREQAG
jgi:hypothetical protein